MVVDIRNAKEFCKIVDKLKIWSEPLSDIIDKVYEYADINPRPKGSDLMSDLIGRAEKHLSENK